MKKTKFYWVISLLLIVVLATALRVKFYVGFVPTDDAEYAKIAYQMSQGEFDRASYDGPAVSPLRTGIVLPTALMFKLFGPSEWTMAAYPCLISILLVLLIFAFTASIFNPTAGLIAAFIWATMRYDFTFATSLRPDVPSMFYAFLGIYLIFLARRNSGLSRPASLLMGLISGLMFGFSWLCKESVVYFIPFCLILMIYDLKKGNTRHLSVWSGVCAGAVLVFGTETLYYYFKTDVWLFRLQEMERNYRQFPQWFYNEGSAHGWAEGASYMKAIIKRVIVDGPATIILNRSFNFIPFMGLIALVRSLCYRDNKYYYIGMLFFTLFIMFNFFTSSFTSYKPLPLLDRYFYPLCFIAVIALSGMISELLAPLMDKYDKIEGREKVFWGVLVSAVLIIISSYDMLMTYRNRGDTYSATERQLARKLSPQDVIYTDPQSIKGLEFFWKYPEKMNAVNYAGLNLDDKVPCNSYVLLNKTYTSWLSANPGMWLNINGFSIPQAIADSTGSWDNLWHKNNSTLFFVNCE